MVIVINQNIKKELDNYNFLSEFEGIVKSKVFERSYKLLYEAKSYISNNNKILYIEFHPDHTIFHIFYSISEKNKYITTSSNLEGEISDKKIKILFLNKNLEREEVYIRHKKIIQGIELSEIKNPTKILKKIISDVFEYYRKIADKK